MTRSSKGSKSSSLRIGNKDVGYSLVKRDVKYPRIEFKTGDMVVVVPKDFDDEKILLDRKFEWIARKHKEISDACKNVSKSFMGNLVFDGPEYLLTDSMEKVSEKLSMKMKIILDRYSEKLGIKYGEIKIRNQTTKWGSCSPGGNMNFNIRLAFLPKRLTEYIAFHELLHMKEAKHNSSFWDCVEKEFADYKELEKSLLEHWFFLQKFNDLFYQS